jgi:hypothetical protein
MPKRSSSKKSRISVKRRTPTDVNQIAAHVVEITTGQPRPGKNPAAVALGRLGGLKGGKVRAEKLSEERRHQIASAAARARWAKEKED